MRARQIAKRPRICGSYEATNFGQLNTYENPCINLNPAGIGMLIDCQRGGTEPLSKENFEERIGLEQVVGLPRLISFIDQYCVDLGDLQFDE